MITIIIIYLSTVSLNMLGMEIGGLLWGPDSCIGILTAPSGFHDLENENKALTRTRSGRVRDKM